MLTRKYFSKKKTLKKISMVYTLPLARPFFMNGHSIMGFCGGGEVVPRISLVRAWSILPGLTRLFKIKN